MYKGTTDKGLFIVIEGGEGAGKSTLAKTLKTMIEKNHNRKVVLTHEPGATEFGQEIRNIFMRYANLSPEVEASLMLAARMEHCENIIIPALEKGEIVICDRYMYSNLVYQGYLTNNKKENMRKIFCDNFNNRFFVEPNIAFYLDVDSQKGLKRIEENKREKNRFDTYELTYHKNVRDGFLQVFQTHLYCPTGRIIDADKSAEELANTVYTQLIDYFI